LLVFFSVSIRFLCAASGEKDVHNADMYCTNVKNTT